MGLVVDPLFVPPAPPAAVVSADQRLSALLDPAHSGVTLKADLTERVLEQNLHVNPSWRATSGTVEVRRNLATNPVSDAGTVSTGIGPSRGTLSVEAGFLRLTVNDASPGSFAQRFNMAGSGYYIDAAPGDVVSVSSDARTDSGSRMGVMLIWIDSANAVVGSTVVGAYKDAPMSGWARVSATAIAPAGTAKVAWYVGTENAGAVVKVGNVLDMRHLLVEKAEAALPYIDGDTPAADGLTYSWTGAAGASPSIATGAAFTTAPFTHYTALTGAVSWQPAPGVMRSLFKRTVSGNGQILLFAGSGSQVVSGAAPGEFYSGRFAARVVVGGELDLIPYLWGYGGGFGKGSASGGDLVVVPAGGAWTDVVALAKGAAAAEVDNMRWYVKTGGAAVTAGTVLEFKEALTVKVDAAGVNPPPYFDGATSTTDAGIGYRWTGPADASTSEEWVPAVVDGSGELPAFVRFLRGDQLVRSGDPARAPGGVAVAYDHEAPLGAASTWSGVPVFVDGTEGDPVGPVSLLVPEDLARVDDVWVKSTTDPTLSVRATVVALPELSLGGRAEFTRVPGDAHPSSSWDVHDAPATTLSVLTSTRAERAALEALLDSGPLLLQSVSAVDLEDLHFLPGDVSWRWTDGSREPGREWSVEVTAIERPATIDAPLRIPDRTCADLLESYPSCGALAAQVATNLELLGVS